jgi:hypothetical protein
MTSYNNSLSKFTGRFKAGNQSGKEQYKSVKKELKKRCCLEKFFYID